MSWDYQMHCPQKLQRKVYYCPYQKKVHIGMPKMCLKCICYVPKILGTKKAYLKCIKNELRNFKVYL